GRSASGRETRFITRSAMFTAWSPIRSRSAFIFVTAVMKRRSTAIGCCMARRSSASSSISRSAILMARSPLNTSSHRARSRRCKPAWTGQLPVQPARPWPAVSASVHPALHETGYALSEPSCNVVLRTLILRSGKQLFRAIKFHQPAHEEEAGEFSYARRLLHVMRDDHDGVSLFQLINQIFDLCR